MTEISLKSTLGALEHISDAYLKRAPLEQARATASQWRPRNGLWQKSQKLAGHLPGLSLDCVSVDGHELHYWRLGSGNGTPIVLVHGFGASKENWISLIPALAGRNQPVLVLDLPGFGASGYRYGARYTYLHQAQRLAHWSRKLDLPPAHWVGSSMGGAICATLAARHPESVAAITLMNAAGVGSTQPSALEEELLKGKNPLIPENSAEVQRLFRMTTHRGSQIFSRLMAPALRREMIHRAPVNQLLFADMLQPEIRVPELLAQVTAPAQVLWGARDQVVDLSGGKVYAKLLPRARLDILADIGHLPMLEAPLQTARRIRAFRREHRVATHQV